MASVKKLERSNVEDILALTPVQEGMLFHYLNTNSTELYFEQLSFNLSGEINPEQLKKAWEHVVQSNEMLRTVYRWEGLDKPIQVVLKVMDIPLKEYDFSAMSETEKQKALGELKEKDRKEKIDIAAEPYRVLLCKLDKNNFEMIVSSYHIVFDGWSNGIILKELVGAYNSLEMGQTLQKPAKNRYKEFIRWVENQDKGKQESFWKRYLKGFNTKTLLPVDKKKGTGKVDTQNHVHILPEDLSTKTRRFAKENNITLATLLYSAWGILLQKYNNNDDVVFGTTISGRTPEIKGVEDIVGLFINTPPVRIKALTDTGINDFLSDMDAMMREREEYECTPLTSIKPYADIDSKEELFDSIVVIENYPLDKALGKHDGKLKLGLASIFEMTNYDITAVISTFDEIALRMIYDANLFEDETIKRVSKQFEIIVEQLVGNPGNRLSEIDMLSEAERKLILFDFNSNAAVYPKDSTIHGLFEEQVLKTPDNIAVRFENQTMTYRELNSRANQLARVLVRRGVEKENVVGIMMERSLDMAVSLMAILKAGGAYLPIDLNLPADRVVYMLEDAKAKVVLTKSDAVKNIPFTALQGFEGSNEIKIAVTAPRTHIKDFDKLPVPDRSLIDIGKYKGKIGMASVNNCISVQTTRGCPYKCLYCHKIWSKHHVHRSAENIYNEIEYYNKNGVTNFAVIDDCFNLDIQNSRRLFELIIKNKLDLQLFFPNGLRGDILTPEYIDLMVEAGTRGINLSLETASPRLQKLLMKNLDLDKFKNVVDYIATKHSNIILEMATMHGFPTETEEEAMMTLNFIKDIKWLHFPYVHILKIFPNTEMEEFALENGISKENILLSKNRAFHELPETLPFPKSFTRKYQASFMNEYFLSKERLKQVLPVQMKILDETALIQKYNAYLPVEIKSIEDIVNFAQLEGFVIPEDRKQDKKDVITIFDRKTKSSESIPGAKKVMFLDLSQHFSSKSMLYKVSEQPIGHIYLLTYLKQKFGDRIDGRIYKAGNDFDSFEELKALVDEYKPDMIGIRTLTYFKEFFHETVSHLRQWGVEAPIITGGPYASSDYDTILKDSNVNLVLFGEGEYTLSELVEKMLENGFAIPEEEVLSTINGIAFAKNNGIAANTQVRQVMLLDTLKDVVDSETDENLEPVSGAENLAYVMYTSGSTGKPKGVMVEHRHVNNCIFWMQKEFGLDEKSVIVQRTNLSFDPSVWEFFWPLYIGGSVRLITYDQGRDADYLLNLMEKDDSLTMMYCPASMVTGMNYILNAKTDKPELKMPWLIIGAEPISSDTVKSFYSYFKGTIVNTYGPTECTINNTYCYLDRNSIPEIVPIGRTVANNNIYILSKDMQPMPLKAAGEIYISGDSVARGYINNPEKTADSFLRNPFGEGKLYKTGDVGRWLTDGSIEIMGRVDEQVKIRGYRIELGEIETAIKRYRNVNDCTVVVKGGKKPASEIRTCNSCGITSEYPGVTVNDEGVCGICQNLDMYKKYNEKYFKNLEDLDNLLKSKQETKKSQYDCILLYSGGRGSAHALYRLVDMGYKVLTLTYDNGYFAKSDMENIKKITGKLGVDHVVLTHKNTDKILKESCKLASTVCRGCFHTSSSIAAEYAYKNNINVVIGATLSRGQIIENKLMMYYQQGISDSETIAKGLKNLQKSTPELDKSIFDLIDIEVVKNGEAYDAVTFVDFYRFCDITNNEMLDYLNSKDEYWKTRKNYAIYSTNCPIKQIGDYGHLKEKGHHYYGSATSWEMRLGHITMENYKQDLKCFVTEGAFQNFSRRIGYEGNDASAKIEDRYICAYVVADGELDVLELKEQLSKEVPGYMVPSYFVRINEIPLTSNGKVDKKALPEPDKSANKSAEYVAPENELEENIVEVWQKVLKIDRISRNDNFFDLGGNSLLLIQMHTQLENLYPGKTTMTDLFAYPTVMKLAEYIESKSEENTKPIEINPIALEKEYISEGGDGGKTSSYNFKLKGEIQEKLKKLAENEGLVIYDLLVSAYAYMLYQAGSNRKLCVQTMTDNTNKVYSMDLDLSDINDFSQLFKLIGSARTNKTDSNIYGIKNIRNITADKGSSGIIPFIYDKKLLEAKVNLLDAYDLIFELNAENEDLEIVVDYNDRKLKSSKMKEFVSNYTELIQMIINNYNI